MLSMNKIERSDIASMLNEFWNIHLREFLSAMINMNIWNNISDKNATAYVKPGPVGVNGQPMQIKVKVGEALILEQNRYKNQQRILRTIIDLSSLDRMDLDKKIFEDFKTDVEKIVEYNKGKEEK